MPLSVESFASGSALAHETEFSRFFFQCFPIGSLAHKYHPEIPAAVGQDLERVQDQRKILVIDQASDKQKQRHAFRQVITGRHFCDCLLVHSALGKINAIVHDAVITLETERLEGLSCSVTDNPDVVAGLDIADHGLDGLIGDQVDLHGALDINIIFGVIRVDDRRAGHLPYQSRNDCRGRGSVGVDDIRLKIRQCRDRFSDQRITRAVAVGLLGRIKTGISDHLIGILIIFAVRIFRRSDFNTCAKIPHHIVGIVHQYIDDSVDDRRKRFI